MLNNLKLCFIRKRLPARLGVFARLAARAEQPTRTGRMAQQREIHVQDKQERRGGPNVGRAQKSQNRQANDLRKNVSWYQVRFSLPPLKMIDFMKFLIVFIYLNRYSRDESSCFDAPDKIHGTRFVFKFGQQAIMNCQWLQTLNKPKNC
jgi:hypothetical protein